jgi:hypothetical protein
MVRQHHWKPTSHEEVQNRMRDFASGFTTEFRARVGASANTPIGKFVDEELTPKLMAHGVAYGDWVIASKRTPEAIKNLKKAEEELLPVYYQVVTMLTGIPMVTDADLGNLGFPPRPSGEKHPAPKSKDIVEYEVEVIAESTVAIHFRDKSGEHERGKPDGQHGVECRGAVRDGKSDLLHKDLTRLEFATKSPLVLEFDDADQGKHFYFSLRWENSRAEKGPWTPIAFFIIP